MYTNDPCMIPRFNSLNRDYWFASQAYVFLFFEYRIPLFFHFHFFLILLQNYGFSLELPNDFLKKRERTDWFVEK